MTYTTAQIRALGKGRVASNLVLLDLWGLRPRLASISDLAEITRSSISAATCIVDSLERRGLVTRIAHYTKHGRVFVQLTDRAVELISSVIQAEVNPTTT